MNIELLSSKFDVRFITEYDIQDVYSLCKDNPVYYKYCPPNVTIESIKSDMVVLPNGSSIEDKFYIGFYNGTELIAIMDLILKYPNKNFVFIGFFMMKYDYQAKGQGTHIIKEVCEYIKDLGFSKIQLCYAKGNKQSEMFWLKNNFNPINLETKVNDYKVILLEKEL